MVVDLVKAAQNNWKEVKEAFEHFHYTRQNYLIL
jgi:hypothetical protein